MKAKLGPDHPDTLNSMNNLAAGYGWAKRLDLSIPLFEEALELQSRKPGRNHPDTQQTVANLGVTYKDAGRVNEAIPLLEEAVASSQRFPNLREFRTALRDAYIKGNRLESFATLAAEELNEARASHPAASAELAAVLVSLGKDFLTLGEYQRAQKLLTEGLSIRQQVAPDLWNTFNAQSLMGGAVLAQASADEGDADSDTHGETEVKAKRLADAEPLLLAGYEGMKQRESTIPPQAATCIPEALDRLIELYLLLDKPEQVARYRDLRSEYSVSAESPK
jgi:tetratricopeptide (TPR) repeat protein